MTPKIIKATLKGYEQFLYFLFFNKIQTVITIVITTESGQLWSSYMVFEPNLVSYSFPVPNISPRT